MNQYFFASVNPPFISLLTIMQSDKWTQVLERLNRLKVQRSQKKKKQKRNPKMQYIFRLSAFCSIWQFQSFFYFFIFFSILKQSSLLNPAVVFRPSLFFLLKNNVLFFIFLFSCLLICLFVSKFTVVCLKLEKEQKQNWNMFTTDFHFVLGQQFFFSAVFFAILFPLT